MLNVIKNRNLYYGISGVLTIIALLFLLVFKLNLGIDMTGGIQTEYSYKNINIEEVRSSIKEIEKTIKYNGKEVINATEIYKITGEEKFDIVAGFDSSIPETDLENLKIEFKNKALDALKTLDSGIIETQYINIGKSFGDYIKDTAILTLILAIFGIAIYLAWAFSGVLNGWKIILSFSGIVIITLFHDLIVATGFYVFTSNFLPEFKIDTFFITALLTILGYSINDTIVVFDRIRTNLKLYSKKDRKSLDEIINLSINETLKRSVYTSLMVVIILVSILLFGPETIKGFVLTMIYGTLIGTYSSVFIAAPMLFDFNKNEKIEIYERKIISAEDKIVV